MEFVALVSGAGESDTDGGVGGVALGCKGGLVGGGERGDLQAVVEAEDDAGGSSSVAKVTVAVALSLPVAGSRSACDDIAGDVDLLTRRYGGDRNDRGEDDEKDDRDEADATWIPTSVPI